MSWYAVRKCDSINSYICLHLSKATSNFILVLSHKDQAFSHNNFFQAGAPSSKPNLLGKHFLGRHVPLAFWQAVFQS
jgi:hypothetical protein